MGWLITWEVPRSDDLALRMGKPKVNYSERHSGMMRVVQ
jgi:hypothetical protein